MAIVARLINFCWFVFKWGLVLALIGAALAAFNFYRRFDEEVRRRVEMRLARLYPRLRVSVRWAAVVKGEGIEIRGLSISEPGAEGPRAELYNVDECFLRCKTDWSDLLAGEPDVTQVAVRGATLRATRRPDGTWSVAKLLPLPRLGKRPPLVRIENGTIDIFDPLRSPSSTLLLREVGATFTPVAEPGAADGLSDRRKLSGTLRGDFFRHVVFEGLIDPRRETFTLDGSIEGLEISPELRASLPGAAAERLGALAAVRGEGELNFHVAYDPAAASPLAYSIAGRVYRGRIDDPRLPHPLTDIHAVVRLDNQGFAVEDLAGRSNQATLRLSASGKGPGEGRPLTLAAEIRQLELDPELVAVLPEDLQEQWRQYRPFAQIDADVKLQYDGRAWRPDLTLRCSKLSFTHHKFPYRLEDGRGTVSLKDDAIDLHLAAYSGNQQVRIDGQLHGPLSDPVGSIDIKGEDLPLDAKLFDALPERCRAVARALDLRGTISFFEDRLWRQSANEPFHQQLVLDVDRCWLRYERFPFSLANIRGTLTMIDDNWTIHSLEGTNGAARVTCRGELTATPQGQQTSLLLRLNASDVPLEDELRDALPPSMRQVWIDLKPRGMIDLKADLHYVDGANLLSVSVHGQPRSEITSIEPAQFPYRLEKLQGTFAYRDGRVTLEHLKGEHGAVKVAASGVCDCLPGGGWHLRLENLAVDQLRVDRDLMQAVPQRLRKALVELNPSGAFSLRGGVEFARGAADDLPRCQWDLAVGLQQAAVDCGVRLENIFGSVTLAGGFDGRNCRSRGELAIESLTYKDRQLTRLMGPLWVDDDWALFGAGAELRGREKLSPTGPLAERPRSLTASVYRGTAYGDAWVQLGPQPLYGARITLVDGQLAAWAQDALPGRQNLNGRVWAKLEVQGAGRTCNGLAGNGEIHLRDADIYELPVMVSMLKLLSIRPPDQNAFSESDIHFKIRGEHVYFDPINVHGDAISLLGGKGEMTSQSEVHLAFAAVVGRGDLPVPAVRNFFTGLSQQFLLIHVDGPLQDPTVRQEAFPGIKQALQKLDADLRRQEMPPSSPPEGQPQPQADGGAWNRR